MTPSDADPVRVWDFPTRLFHWTLAAAVAGSVTSAKIGGAAMVWHFRLGYLVFGLLLFRLVWGLMGGRWSRFSSFLYGPGALMRYLRGEPRAGERFDVGHNPLGALSVFALLLVLAVQVATGLVGDDEIASVGPLNRFVATATGLAATAWHKHWGQWLLLGLVALHLSAIAFYAWRRHNLIGAMVHGDKALPADVPASVDDASARLRALAVAAACTVAVWLVVRLGG
jgi:cytochrome b